MKWSLEKNFKFLQPITGDSAGLNSILSTVINLLLLISALASFGYLVFAGIQYITSAGDPEKASKARQGIIYALIGVTIIILSYAFLMFYVGGLTTGKWGSGGNNTTQEKQKDSGGKSNGGDGNSDKGNDKGDNIYLDQNDPI